MALSNSSKALVVAMLSDAMDDADCLPAIQQEEDQASSSAAASTFMVLATTKEPSFNHKIESFVLEDVPRYNEERNQNFVYVKERADVTGIT